MKDKKEKIAINMLKGLLDWSDRIGSDEISEIQEIIKILNGKYDQCLEK
jgi:hypothetical protein|tara:strand:- start:4564 stop:4710 length:147 start_codon:yes stop_codon:yes gene_type:complete